MRALYEVKLSENFYGREFRCKGEEEDQPCSCHGAVSVDRRLISILQSYRDTMQVPIHLTSAFRCDDYNKAVGGHESSFHRIGWAADVTSIHIRKDLDSAGHDIGDHVEDVLGVGKGNVIVYRDRGFIHVDCGHRVAKDLVRFK